MVYALFGFAREKVKGGKLLYVKVDYDGKRINEIQVLGDFFAHPESGISSIERILRGVALDKNELQKAINLAIASEHIELIGIDAESLSEVIMKSVVK